MTRLPVALALALAAAAAAGAAELESEHEKFSYAIGLQITQSLIRQGIEVHAEAFHLAVDDALEGRTPRLAPDELAAVVAEREQRASGDLRERAKANLQRGREFLEKNAEREDVQVMESGLQFRIIREGDGPRPKPGDTVRVHYTGALIDGREFDSSYRRKEPAIVALDDVIAGWAEALELMQVGAMWQLYVPPDLAYGVSGAGGAIGPNETLIFDLELLEIIR